MFNDAEWILYDYRNSIMHESNIDNIITLNNTFLKYSEHFDTNVNSLKDNVPIPPQ